MFGKNTGKSLQKATQKIFTQKTINSNNIKSLFNITT